MTSRDRASWKAIAGGTASVPVGLSYAFIDAEGPVSHVAKLKHVWPPLAALLLGHVRLWPSELRTVTSQSWINRRKGPWQLWEALEDDAPPCADHPAWPLGGADHLVRTPAAA